MQRILIAAACLALAGAPGAALADPGHGHGHGKGHARHHVPPGQAKKMWRRGEHIPVAYVAPRYYVTDYRYYRLPPPPLRYRYVVVERHVYLVDPTTRLIRDVVDLLAR